MLVAQVLPYWGNPHDRKVIRKFWSQVSRRLQNQVRISTFLQIVNHVALAVYVENAVHAERTLPRGDHELPAGGAGREVFPAGQVAVHGSG